MQLIIAEKPAVGSTIASVIGNMERKDGYFENKDYIVSWCIGHIVELEEPQAYGDKVALPIIPDEWLFRVSSGKEGQFNTLSKLMHDDRITEVVCATDAGREGECIFRYVYNKADCKKPFKRLWTSSLEESAIRAALNDLKDGTEYDNLYEAGLCRAKADWLVGMNFSRHYTNLYGYPENPITHKKSLSYGRVMTPVLKMIIDRNEKVKNFVKEKYYTVELDCGEFIATSDKFENIEQAKTIAEKCIGSTAVVKSVKREIKNQKPPKLYDLTTLQREANRKFGYTANQTLEYTQSLYESKLVTYPRTDSCYITDDMETTAADVFEIICNYFPFAKNISFTPNIKATINNAKVSDHHALLPTKLVEDKNLDEIPEAERNILYLIAARLICAVSTKYTYESVSAIIECEHTDFKISGRTDIDRGWKAVYEEIQKELKGEKDEPESDDKSVPDLKEAQTFENVSAETAEHFTSPPKLFTEDTLLSAMETAGNTMYEIADGDDIEKKGLGTPATRAAAIEKLVNSGYVERKKKQLIPTDFGCKITMTAAEQLKSPILTVDWETKLQKIEHGEYSSSDFMSEIEEYVRNIISTNLEVPEEYKNLFPQSSPDNVFNVCPLCGGNIYKGKFGYFCENSRGENKSCKFNIRYEDNFFKWKKVPLTDNIAKELIEKGKTFVKGMTAKSGNKFDGYIVLDTSGEYINFTLEFEQTEAKELCKCPKCGSNVYEDKFSFHCEKSKGENRSCNVYLKKEDNFFVWRGKKLTNKHAKELLTKGKTHMTDLKSKSGTLYNADIILDTSGQYVQYEMKFDK